MLHCFKVVEYCGDQKGFFLSEQKGRGTIPFGIVWIFFLRVCLIFLIHKAAATSGLMQLLRRQKALKSDFGIYCRVLSRSLQFYACLFNCVGGTIDFSLLGALSPDATNK